MNEDKAQALLELHKVNAQLFEQIAELVQQSGQQWQSESQRAIAAALAESEAELKALLAAKDLPALLAAQGATAQQRWLKYQAAFQGALQVSVSNSSTLTAKLAEVFGQWYGHVNSVAGSATPAVGAWFGNANPFLQLWSNALGANGASAKKGGAGGK